jgi:oxalyl-CoA decarboxylase
VVSDIGSASPLCSGHGANWAAPPSDWTGAVIRSAEENVAKMAPRLMNNNSPMDYHALGVLRTIIKGGPTPSWSCEGANTLDPPAASSTCTSRAARPTSHLGVMGIGMGYAIRRGRDRQGAHDRRRLGLSFSGMEVRTICRCCQSARDLQQ